MLITMGHGQRMAADKVRQNERMQVAEALQNNEEAHNRDLKDLVGTITVLDTRLTKQHVDLAEREHVQQDRETLESQKEGELLGQLAYACETLLKNQKQAQSDAMRLAADKADLCQQVAELKSQQVADEGAIEQLISEKTVLSQQLVDQHELLKEHHAASKQQTYKCKMQHLIKC
jgi:hypothetical protein